VRFRLWSDVHNDFERVHIHQSSTDFEDTLVIAGDWGTVGQTYEGIIRELCEQFKHVVFVPGNHDFWGSCLKEVDEFWNVFQNNHRNFHYLNPGSVVIDDVLVVGATLWTDCLHGNPLEVEKISRYMTPDFTYIHDFKKDHYEWVGVHNRHFQFIREVLEKNSKRKNPRKVLVVTHHAPHVHCDPDHDFNSGYCCTDMDLLIDPEFVHTWAFGHTHVPVDFELNAVRMISNPRGYKGCEELAGKWDEEALDAAIFEI